ncbi:MAG: septum formation protein Maf [Armatimonadetes bacterium]|nr:septum formation protein Maf [Armatimonadota bacterium]MDE2206968.1 septum formation protein Maf [Armatimonadota bacterium]
MLASGSPRRRDLIQLLGVPVTVEPSRYDEPPAPEQPVDVPAFVSELALCKARETLSRFPRDLVIGADTEVTLDEGGIGRLFGKPRDAADAAKMLRQLAGNTHFVWTGIAVVSAAGEWTASEVTAVEFAPMREHEILRYVATGEPMDKAGGYGAQGLAAPWISGIRGDFHNVVGLPLCRLRLLLQEAGWRHGP